MERAKAYDMQLLSFKGMSKAGDSASGYDAECLTVKLRWRETYAGRKKLLMLNYQHFYLELYEELKSSLVM